MNGVNKINVHGLKSKSIASKALEMVAYYRGSK
jgi:hypothetical protein